MLKINICLWSGFIINWIVIIIIYSLEFFTSVLTDGLYGLSDSKFPQVSWTLLCIRPVLNNAVVWMVSTRPLTSKFSSPFNNPLVTVPKAPITIGIIVAFMFHCFLQFPSIIINKFTIRFQTI